MLCVSPSHVPAMTLRTLTERCRFIPEHPVQQVARDTRSPAAGSAFPQRAGDARRWEPPAAAAAGSRGCRGAQGMPLEVTGPQACRGTSAVPQKGRGSQRRRETSVTAGCCGTPPQGAGPAGKPGVKRGVGPRLWGRSAARRPRRAPQRCPGRRAMAGLRLPAPEVVRGSGGFRAGVRICKWDAENSGGGSGGL